MEAIQKSFPSTPVPASDRAVNLSSRSGDANSMEGPKTNPFQGKTFASHGMREEYSADILNVAARLCDLNIQLMSHLEGLKSRSAQLEEENRILKNRIASSRENMNEGTQNLVEVLQADIADLQRQLHKAKASRRATEEELKATKQRADMMAMMQRVEL